MYDKDNLKSALSRWGILLLISFIIAANYYFYDALSSIKSIMQKELGISNTEYGLIVSFYSFPNTFLLMAILGGIILDKWGIRFTGFLFIFFTAVGSFLTAYGASNLYQHGLGYSLMSSFLKDYSPELKMMILGRLFFGLGAETSIVVLNKIIVKWFKGKELAFAFAVNLAIARIGTALALILSPVFIGKQVDGNFPQWTNAIWLASILVISSFIAFIIYSVYDKKFDKKNKISLITDEEKFHLSDILSLLKNRSFIYITLLCVTFYAAVFPFLAYAPDLLFNKFNINPKISGTITSILPFGTILFTPLFGWIVDKRGKTATLMIYGSLILIFVHLLLSLTYLPPYIPMFLLGIAFSLVPAAMWPGVAAIVEEKKIGTAYGIMFSIQNLGMFLFPIIAGKILDITPKIINRYNGSEVLNYKYAILVFAGLGILGLIFAFLLKIEDRKHNNRLENLTIAAAS
jgi:MFS family permease